MLAKILNRVKMPFVALAEYCAFIAISKLKLRSLVASEGLSNSAVVVGGKRPADGLGWHGHAAACL